MAEGFIDSAEKATASLERLLRSSNGVQDSLNKFGGSSAIFTNLTSTIDDFNKTLSIGLGNFEKFVTGLGAGTGLIGQNLKKSLDESGGLLSNLVSKTTGYISLAVSAGEAVIDAFDAPSKGLRDLDANMYNLNARFGESLQKSKEFSDSFNLASVSGFSDSLKLSNREVLSFINGTAQTSLNLDQLSQIVDTGAGKVELFAAATGIARATTLSASDAATILNRAINEQGKTAQQAVDEFGTYIATSKETGLSIDKVATTLSNASSQFRNLGMSVDFAKPILESYSKVVKDIGLGVEQSTALTTNFTSGLGKLTESYSNAYLLFQRGGLNIPGLGGAQQGLLGASIGIRQALIEAEKGGEQGDIARSLSEGLRDTLKSLTGGSIVTLEQASRSPALQTQYYTQEQLLTSQFGFQDPKLVLDLLSSLETAIQTGDEGSREALEKQIKEATDNADQNMDASEKLKRVAEQQLNLAMISYRDESMYLRSIAEGITGFLGGAIKSGAEAADFGEKPAAENLNRRDEILKQLTASDAGRTYEETSKLIAELGATQYGPRADNVSGRTMENIGGERGGTSLPEAIGSAIEKKLSGISISITLNTTPDANRLISVVGTTASVAKDVLTGQQNIAVTTQGAGG
jgi:hypothetical protein